MKNFILVFFILTLQSCSFVNIAGVWDDASNIPVENDDTTSLETNESKERYENIFNENKEFNEEISVKNNLVLDLEKPTRIDNWPEKYGVKTNNISNFLYIGDKLLSWKSSKLSKLSGNKNIIFYQNNLISYDHKGKIFVYSIDQKKKLFVYDFYKKNFKHFTKRIYITVRKNVLYAVDNLGYVYAIDLEKKSLIWAKNYGIPFRSNLKIVDQQLLAANQDNVIYSIDTSTGKKNWQFATKLTFLKTDFENNFAIDKFNNNLFFLNTSGELYSINYINQKINWVLNFKNSSAVGDTQLFLSQPIVIKNDSLIVATEKATLYYDIQNALKKWNFPSGSIVRPILTSNSSYIVSKNGLLICIENTTGKVLWSVSIYKGLERKIKNKIGNFYDFKIVNGEINLFSKNGYLLVFNHKNGIFKYAKKISKSGIKSEAVFLKGNMFLLDDKNRLLKFN